nr:MFS transporter [Candidatus Microthrix sp.]
MHDRVEQSDSVYQDRWITLIVLCVSLLVIVLDNTILNVALPRMARPAAEGGLGASQSQLQWIVDSYTIVFAGLLLTTGTIGDRFGRYRFLTVGLIIFGTGSVLSALASDANVLIGTRALMGVGGAFIMPATLSILTTCSPTPRSGPKRSESGPGSRPWGWGSARSPAAFCWPTSGGGPSFWSTFRS